MLHDLIYDSRSPSPVFFFSSRAKAEKLDLDNLSAGSCLNTTTNYVLTMLFHYDHLGDFFPPSTSRKGMSWSRPPYVGYRKILISYKANPRSDQLTNYLPCYKILADSNSPALLSKRVDYNRRESLCISRFPCVNMELEGTSPTY